MTQTYDKLVKTTNWNKLYGIGSDTDLDTKKNLLISMHVFSRGFSDLNYNTRIDIETDYFKKRLFRTKGMGPDYITNFFRYTSEWDGNIIHMEEYERSQETAKRITELGLERNAHILKTHKRGPELWEADNDSFFRFIAKFPKPVYLSGGYLWWLSENGGAGCLGMLAADLEKNKVISSVPYQTSS